MNLEALDLAFPREYLRAAVMVSLLSVWLLVGLFVYLNRYTKRQYFTVWTAAWLFYALWLTLGLHLSKVVPGNIVFMLQQFCVAISATFLLWGSLSFLGLEVPQRLFGLFMLFLVVWTIVSPHVLTDTVQIQLPIFILLGLSSIFAGVCFFRLRRRMPFVGAGMLSLGFLLWGLYLTTYPISQKYDNLASAGFFVGAVLQLFIAVSMIVLVLEEVRYKNELILQEIATVRSEKEALQSQVLGTEEKYRSLFDQVRLTKGVEQAYEELRRTQQVVVQHERLRALGQMASGVAHDINNALTPVTAYTDLLLNTLSNLPEGPRRHLESIHKAARDIEQIVVRMREFYRPRFDTEQLSQVSIDAIIHDVGELTRPRWRDLSQREGVSIQINFELQPEIPTLLSNPSELRQALTNLVFNSVDAMPQGGTITLATRVLDLPTQGGDPTPVPHLRIEVRDNGTGMDEKTRQHCLEPFFSTKAQRGGSGLGLAMVYGMMRRHDGTIEVESVVGRGTCIHLTFPFRQPQARSAVEPRREAAASRTQRILCIEEEPLIRRRMDE